MADDLVMPERIPDENLEPMIMPDGERTLIPKTWSGEERRAFVEKKFPGAYDEPAKYAPKEGTLGFALKDTAHALHDTIEEGVAAVPGLPGTLIELGRRGLRGLGLDSIVAEPPLGSSKIPTGQDLLHEYRDLRGEDPESYEPKSDLGKWVAPLGHYALGGVGRLASAVPRVLTNVVAPAIGETIGGKAAEQFRLPKEIGEGVGGLLGWGTAAGIKATRMPKIRPDLEDVEGMTNTAKEVVQRANDAGVVVFRKALKNFDKELEPMRAHIDERAHPQATAVLKYLDKKMQPDATGKFMDTMTLEDLETMRRNISSIGKNPAESHLYFEMKRKFTKFMDNLSPTDVAKGNTKEGLEAFREFRKIWHRRAKTEEIEDILDHADLKSLSGAEKGEVIRRKFSQYVDPLGAGKRNRKKFTPQEWDMLEEVAKGRPLERTLRWIGEFSPSKLKGLLGAGLAFDAGGAAAATGYGVATAVPRHLANRISRGNAQRVYDSVRGGVPLDAPPSAGAAANLGTGAGIMPFDLPPIKDYGRSEDEDELMKRDRMIKEGQQ